MSFESDLANAYNRAKNGDSSSGRISHGNIFIEYDVKELDNRYFCIEIGDVNGDLDITGAKNAQYACIAVLDETPLPKSGRMQASVKL
jgi:hypothetical protein